LKAAKRLISRGVSDLDDWSYTYVLMAGRNLFTRSGTASLTEKKDRPGATCVFISHQFADLPLAIEVGDQLKALEIDIWLDVEDVACQQAVAAKDDRKLAEAIEAGLSNCSHLLALISPKTRESWWVPYEIGSVRGRNKPLAFFVHKDVTPLPAYLVLGRRILDQIDFYGWSTEISTNKYLTESKAVVQKSAGFSTIAGLLPRIRTA
jgi:hypothetical protein